MDESNGLAAAPAGVFAACGTGEFHALRPTGYQQVVRSAVEVTANAVPVFAAIGGPLPMVCEFAVRVPRGLE